MVHNLLADYYVHHFQAGIDSSGYSGADDAVGLEVADKFDRSGSGIHFADATLHQDDGILLDVSFNVGERTFFAFSLVLELISQLLLFGRHGRNDSYFHALKKILR